LWWCEALRHFTRGLLSQKISDILNPGVFYLEDAGADPVALDRRQWCAHACAVCLPAESLAITVEDGLWQTLNERFDLLFDLYEEQEIAADVPRAVTDALEELIAPYADMDHVERVVAMSDGIGQSRGRGSRARRAGASR
jgi:hypothetical protein